MARRVTIAQLLLLQPELMILDEPTAGLDTIARQEFMGMLKGILNSHAQSLLFITHDLRLLPGLTDRISIMLRGFLIEDRLAGALIRNPLHPYSQKLHQLLRGKSVHNQGTEENQRNRSLQGCPFSGECPQVMPICLEHLPPPVLIPKEGMVRCFLHANKTTN
jgi:peptide/nickel transport system ATP-binding protein